GRAHLLAVQVLRTAPRARRRPRRARGGLAHVQGAAVAPSVRDRHAAARAARGLREAGRVRRVGRLGCDPPARAVARRTLPRRRPGRGRPPRAAVDGQPRADLCVQGRRALAAGRGATARRPRSCLLGRRLLRSRDHAPARPRRRGGGARRFRPLQHARGSRPAPRGARRAVRLLVLGGTKFLGRHAVDAALADGHEVTTFTRGRTNPDLFPDVEHLHGDRDGDLAALEAGRWDGVVDTSGYVPRIVRQSAELLRDRVDRYVFVSSISVYADFSAPVDESTPLEELQDPGSESIEEHYGALKAACERVVEEVYGERSARVRAGLIVGPHDPTDRFTYWPRRIALGGDV